MRTDTITLVAQAFHELNQSSTQFHAWTIHTAVGSRSSSRMQHLLACTHTLHKWYVQNDEVYTNKYENDTRWAVGPVVYIIIHWHLLWDSSKMPEQYDGCKYLSNQRPLPHTHHTLRTFWWWNMKWSPTILWLVVDVAHCWYYCWLVLDERSLCILKMSKLLYSFHLNVIAAVHTRNNIRSHTMTIIDGMAWNRQNVINHILLLSFVYGFTN